MTRSQRTCGVVDGMTLIRTPGEILPQVRRIVLTGYGSIPGALEAVRRGADDYLLKPASADQVLAALKGKSNTSLSPAASETPASLASSGSTSSRPWSTAP